MQIHYWVCKNIVTLGSMGFPPVQHKVVACTAQGSGLYSTRYWPVQHKVLACTAQGTGLYTGNRKNYTKAQLLCQNIPTSLPQIQIFSNVKRCREIGHDIISPNNIEKFSSHFTENTASTLQIK
jgi:hypothetical protein